jgi:hypothetical protein
MGMWEQRDRLEAWVERTGMMCCYFYCVDGLLMLYFLSVLPRLVPNTPHSLRGVARRLITRWPELPVGILERIILHRTKNGYHTLL